jgi:hypothetical protein
VATTAAQRQRKLELEAQRTAAAQRQRQTAATLRAGKSPFKPFKPYQPPNPAGYYDPALDAQKRAAGRGYLDTQQDTALAGTRSAVDYGLGMDAINQSFDRGAFDLTRSRDRGLEDIGTQRGYETADYTRNTGLLTRQYGQLARKQAEGARKYGVTSGGIALLSAAKRAENQGIEQQTADIAHTRAQSGFDTSTTRLGEDYTTGYGRLGEDRTTATGQLDVNYGRGVDDRTLALSRAGRENTLFGSDINASKAYQAAQNNYIAPARGAKGGIPTNERIGAGGAHTRTQTFNGIQYTYDPTGRIISQKRVKKK